MIDKKKIQKGMKACLDRRIDDKVERENMRDPLIAYTRAFDDAIDWFKQAIWHDISEEPKENERIITEFRDNGVSYELDIPYENWECYCAFNNILRWCYLSDILPEGGEK